MPLADPEARKAYYREYARRAMQDPEKKKKQREACKKWYEKKYKQDDSYRIRKNKMRVLSKYGLKIEDYERMLEDQDYKCFICLKPHEEKPRKRLHVDHCHKTGKVRGLLCPSCNTSMGKLEDDVCRLKRMIAYLERSGE
jgi:hypothetical protein